MQAVLFSDTSALSVSSSLEALARVNKRECIIVRGDDDGWL